MRVNLIGDGREVVRLERLGEPRAVRLARGEATPASDIDLLYEAARSENRWQLWSDLLELLERILGRVVDLHEMARMPDRAVAGAVTVWRQPKGRQQGGRKTETAPDA